MTMLGPRPATRLLAPLLFALLIAGPIRAQAPGAAEVLFREAVTLAKQGKYPEAIAKFHASYELDPARGTLLGWALAEQRAGKIASALAHYQQVRSEAQQAGDRTREAQATQAIAALVARVPTLTITTTSPLPDRAEISLGGRELPAGALDTQLPLDPGPYVLLVVAPSGARFERTITLVEGDRSRVEIDLPVIEPRKPVRRDPPPPPTSPAPQADSSGGWSGLRTAGVITGTVGLVGLGVGAYFWIDSGSQFDRVSDACPGGTCPPDQQSAIESGERSETIGRVLLIAGGVATAAGVTLYALGSRSSNPSRDVSLTLTLRSVDLRGRF